MSTPSGSAPKDPENVEELRQQIDHTRDELAHTVEALAAKADVKSRAKGKAADLSTQAKVKAAEATGIAKVKAARAKATAGEVQVRILAGQPGLRISGAEAALTATAPS